MNTAMQLFFIPTESALALMSIWWCGWQIEAATYRQNPTYFPTFHQCCQLTIFTDILFYQNFKIIKG